MAEGDSDLHDDDGAPAATLEEQRAALSKPLGDAYRRLGRARKALDDLGSGRAQGYAIGAVADAAKALDDASAALEALDAGAMSALAAALTHHREQTLHYRRGAFIGALRREGREAGVSVELLGDSPPTVLISPLTCELDVERGEARLLFAHEVVGTCELAAADVLAARKDAIDAIHGLAAPSEVFIARLRQAYLMALVARGGAPGDRLDLVDLLGPLALVSHPPERWRQLAAKDLSPFPRYLLAYQLYRLRRDGVLEHEGQRLELGAATGGSTRNKRDVLFVPTTPSDGQYHLSIRFAPR